MEKKKPWRPMKRWNGPEDGGGKKLKKENMDADEALKQNLERRFHLGFGDLPTDDHPGGNKNVFVKNLQFLIASNQMTQAAIAKQAGISFDLLRQWSRRGLARPQKGSRESLDRLRRFFWLDSMAELWSENLIDRHKQAERRAAQMAPHLRSKDWPYAVRFMELLQAGDYGFLRDLIDRLHERELATAGQSYDEGQGEEDRASPGDMARRLLIPPGGHHR